jgi:DNA ligase-1
MLGSGREPYVLKNTGGVYSCSCPAWRNAGGAIDTRSCKHLRRLRGDAAEDHRLARGGEARAARTTGDTVRAEGAAPPVLLAHSWDNVTDLSSWWMSEKLDGVRAYWDGRRFLSRLGNELFAPEWFVEGLPDHPLDGELWGGRKLFQRTVSTVRRQDRGEAWREIRYVAFDLPHLREPFEARLEALAGIVSRVGKAHVEAHAQSRCESLDALREELRRVEALGGEGLMMRRPGSMYEVGRSHTLLKVKSFHDAEARVVGHLPGAGKHKGRLGALECEMPDGTRFSVGTGLSDDERKNPPPIGAIVTYRYQELSNDGAARTGASGEPRDCARGARRHTSVSTLHERGNLVGDRARRKDAHDPQARGERARDHADGLLGRDRGVARRRGARGGQGPRGVRRGARGVTRSRKFGHGGPAG